MKKTLILLVALAAMLGGTGLLNRSTSAQPAARRVEVTASRFAFAPAEITLKVNQPVVIILISSDVAHGLRFREFNQDVNVGKGGSAEMHFTPGKTGEFVGRCSVFCGPGHGEMKLTLHVVE